MSSVRAFGLFAFTGTPTLTYSFNAASIAFSAPNIIRITLNANVVFGNNPVILVSPAFGGVGYTYSFTGGVLTITSTALLSVNSNVHFAILQI